MVADTPFFSIIVPTYNRAARLIVALNSILKQTFQNYEVVIVDDGSTDNTSDALQLHLKQYPFIHYYYKENEERSIARNYGIQKAVGEYICFLDSDDVLYANHLAVAYDLLSRNNYPEVGNLGFETINENGERLSVSNNFDHLFKNKIIIENILVVNSIFIRRDIALQVKFIPSRFTVLAEDWYVWLRLAARYTFFFDNTVTSAVIQHEGRSLFLVNRDHLIKSTQLIIDHLQCDPIFMEAFKGKTGLHFANHLTLVALHLAIAKNRKRESFHFLQSAWQYDFSVILSKRFLATLRKLIFK